jgi:hypothetical protein
MHCLRNYLAHIPSESNMLLFYTFDKKRISYTHHIHEKDFNSIDQTKRKSPNYTKYSTDSKIADSSKLPTHHMNNRKHDAKPAFL